MSCLFFYKIRVSYNLITNKLIICIMKIVLLQDIRGVGKKYEIKDVNDGYARNFLIAKDLAAPADGKTMSLKTAHDAQEADRAARLKKIARGLEDSPLTFFVAGDDKSVFGSVSREDIQQELKQRGFVDFKLDLPKSIKATGMHAVAVDLGRGIRARLKIIVEVKK